MIVLDTNVISETMRRGPAIAVIEFLDGLNADDVFVTSLTVAEIRFGLGRLPVGNRRDALTSAADLAFNGRFEGRVLAFDTDAAEAYGHIASRRQTIGRPLPLVDAMIASICVVHSATLVTRNAKDFEGLGLSLINPW